MKKLRVLAWAIVLLAMAELGFNQSRGRTEHFEYPFFMVGQDLGSCGDFNVLTDYELKIKGVIIYDKDGRGFKEAEMYKNIGRSIYYNSKNPQISLEGGPGEVQTNHYDLVGGIFSASGLVFKVTVPGHGQVYMETGRFILDLNTGEILMDNGHNMADGLQALCGYLAQ